MTTSTMTTSTVPGALDLSDIQNGALHPRPSPYVASYILLRVDTPEAGREVLRRVLPLLDPATDPAAPERQAWISLAVTFRGLMALGVPHESLDSFPEAFRQGMAARAAMLGDIGESGPENWEQPLGSADVHLAISVIARDMETLERLREQARTAYKPIDGIERIWRQDAFAQPDEKEPFGFRDGISHPGVEGSGILPTNPQEAPFKAGEFILGHRDEMEQISAMPQPEVLGKNGTYLVFSKLHTRVAAFRQYVKARSKTEAEENLLAAKIVGRWPSGAPLGLTPEQDDEALGHDPRRNNDFQFQADDPKGLKCPLGSHIRRMNPRDASIVGLMRIHRMIRRSTTYGPPLPKGVIEDDGADRGIIFVGVMGSLERQFEFIKTQWINQGLFFGAPDEKDPLIGPHNGTGEFTIPQKPIRKRVKELPALVVNKGGEYCFLPSLSALRWLADLKT